MQAPIEIASRGIELPDHLKDVIRDYANKLENYFDRITSCHATVDTQDHDHHRKGRFYSINLVVNVPEAQLVVNRQFEEDFHRAVREAFRAMRRELEDYVRKIRGDVKTHERQPRGKVLRLFKDEDYGFLQSEDGREIYFHRNSVVDADFDKLEPGTPVRFAEEMGNEGPQATTVRTK